MCPCKSMGFGLSHRGDRCSHQGYRRGTSVSRKKFIMTTAAVAFVGVVGVTGISGTTANFTASDTGNVKVDTATLTVELSDTANTGSFELKYPSLAPGDAKVDHFTVKNTGSVAADVKIGAPFTGLQANIGQANPNKLTVAIDGYQTLAPVTSVGQQINLGSLAPGQSRTYTVRVGLDSSAGNEWQGKSLSTNVTVTLQQ